MALPQPFAYPTKAHDRRHGPRGYTHPEPFKLWLRDEFQFRCVYCLVRERWHPDGDGGFSVERLQPRSKSPELILRRLNEQLASQLSIFEKRSSEHSVS